MYNRGSSDLAACPPPSAWLDQTRVVLNLEWQLHSGLHAFTRTEYDQVPASEVRTLFRKDQDGAAGIQLPSYSLDSPLEMICLCPTTCNRLYYELGGDKTLNTAHLSAGRCPFHCKHAYYEETPLTRRPLGSYYRRGHYCGQVWGTGYNGGFVNLDRHWPKGDSVCLVTTYQRDILGLL